MSRRMVKIGSQYYLIHTEGSCSWVVFSDEVLGYRGLYRGTLQDCETFIDGLKAGSAVASCVELPPMINQRFEKTLY